MAGSGECGDLREGSPTAGAGSEAGRDDPTGSLTLECAIALVTLMPAEACLTNSEGRYLAVSDGYCRTYGYDREELIGQDYLILYPPEEHAEAISRRRQCYQGEPLSTRSTILLRKDGSTLQVRPEHRMLTLADGQKVLLSLTQDVSSAEEARSDLEVTRAQLEALVDQSLDAVVMTDRDGTVVTWSQGAERIYGIPRDKVLGRHMSEAFFRVMPRGQMAAYTPERLRTTLDEFLNSDPSAWSDIHDRLVERPDGQLRLVQEIVFPVEAEGATFVGSISRDVTDLRTAAEAARESERFAARLIGNLRGVVYRCSNDDQWTMRYLSEGIQALTGYSPDELVDNRVVAYGDLIHPHDRARVAETVASRRGADDHFELEYRIITRSGEEKWVWERGLVASGPGSETLLEGFLADVTEEKRGQLAQNAMNVIAREALTAPSLEALCRAIHHSVEALFPAPNFYVALHERESDIVRFPYYVDEIEPAAPGYQRRRQRGVTEYIVRTGRPALLDRSAVEALNASGEIYVLGGIPHSYLGLPLFDPDGETVGVVAVQSYDPRVTYGERELQLLSFVGNQISLVLRRRRAEEEVIRERDFAQSLVDGAQLVVLVLDELGRVLTFNPFTERLVGRPLQEAIGKDWFAGFVPERERDAARAAFQGALQVGMVSGSTNHVIAAGNQERLLEWHGSILAGPDPGESSFLAIGHDITERTRLQEQLLQSQRLEVVGQLAGGVAHDFNNILTAITGHVQFALDDLHPADKVRDDLAQALQAADRAADLTRQLLAFARRQMLERRRVDLNLVVVQAERMLKRLIGENIELNAEPCSEPHVVLADPVQLEQALVNLVVNARDAMPEGGRLTIGCTSVSLDETRHGPLADLPPGRYAVLSVSDTGHGIAEGIRDHIFEPFYSTKSTLEGTGLGLATVEAIVGRHGGAVGFQTEVGSGTTFSVYLPMLSDSAEQLPARDKSGFLPRGHETILIAEDERAVRAVSRRILAGQGYAVLVAENGEHALELSAEHEGDIHLLVTDVIMPGMSGRELAKALRVDRPDMSVLYVSGYAGGMIGQPGLLEDGSGYLQKPFTVATLARKIRQVLDARR